MKEENNQLKVQIIRLKEENERLKKEQKKNKSENDIEKDESKVFQILGKEEIESMEKIEELGSGGGGKVFKDA